MTKRFHTFFVVFWFQKDEKSPKKCEPKKNLRCFFFLNRKERPNVAMTLAE